MNIMIGGLEVKECKNCKHWKDAILSPHATDSKKVIHFHRCDYGWSTDENAGGRCQLYEEVEKDEN